MAGQREQGDATAKEPVEPSHKSSVPKSFRVSNSNCLLLCDLPNRLLSNRGNGPRPQCTTQRLKDSAAYREIWGVLVALID